MRIKIITIIHVWVSKRSRVETALPLLVADGVGAGPPAHTPSATMLPLLSKKKFHKLSCEVSVLATGSYAPANLLRASPSSPPSCHRRRLVFSILLVIPVIFANHPPRCLSISTNHPPRCLSISPNHPPRCLSISTNHPPRCLSVSTNHPPRCLSFSTKPLRGVSQFLPITLRGVSQFLPIPPHLS
jgi:hypothetical protein